MHVVIPERIENVNPPECTHICGPDRRVFTVANMRDFSALSTEVNRMMRNKMDISSSISRAAFPPLAEPPCIINDLILKSLLVWKEDVPCHKTTLEQGINNNNNLPLCSLCS